MAPVTLGELEKFEMVFRNNGRYRLEHTEESCQADSLKVTL